MYACVRACGVHMCVCAHVCVCKRAEMQFVFPFFGQRPRQFIVSLPASGWHELLPEVLTLSDRRRNCPARTHACHRVLLYQSVGCVNACVDLHSDLQLRYVPKSNGMALLMISQCVILFAGNQNPTFTMQLGLRPPCELCDRLRYPPSDSQANKKTPLPSICHQIGQNIRLYSVSTTNRYDSAQGGRNHVGVSSVHRRYVIRLNKMTDWERARLI